MANKNSNLGAAKAAKNDEFYTQYEDIEREMNAYLEYDENVFRGNSNSYYGLRKEMVCDICHHLGSAGDYVACDSNLK